MDWDTKVEDDVKRTFLQWQQELKQLCHIRIPRWVLGNNEATLSLHLFTDASQEAYGAVIFARVEYRDRVEIHIIEARSRIAPKEKATISGLELLASSVGARLMDNTASALDNQHIDRFYWTDSSTVLA
ncbi:uncharacterized protein [Temnothorax longispinosus]|uniref:uncharacterized protein n=1 Tax=Temnothorax longispinosus TaxID=300112 RepID=UPI003A9969ED